MFDLKNFSSAINQITEERGISKEKIIEGIEMAIAAAYKKEYGEKGQIVKAKFIEKTGEVKFWQIKIVVDESMIYSEEDLIKKKDSFNDNVEAGEEKIRFNVEKHIMLEDAKKIQKKIKVNEELEIELETKSDFGRIAAQTAKQVIVQKIRESERESVFEEFKLKEGEIISGIVQRIEGQNIYFDIGKTLGVLSKEEQVPGEFYRPGQRLKVIVLKVEQSARGPVVFLSRSYPKFVTKLFELEVPEILASQVEIKSIAREAGSRTKISVSSNEQGIDPIGASVGQKGTRVSAVINELGGEKIDIIEYSDDPAKYIINALSPARIERVKVMPKNKAIAIVSDDQLSLAIGKDGQNVRLAAKLTGWKIDVRGLNADNSIDKLDESSLEEKETKDLEKNAVKPKAIEKNKKEVVLKKSQKVVKDSPSEKVVKEISPELKD